MRETEENLGNSFRPIRDNVIILTDETEKDTEIDGIIRMSNMDHAYLKGKVIATGEWAMSANGQIIPQGIQPGDFVLFMRSQADYPMIGREADGMAYKLIPYGRIAGVITKPQENK